MNLETQAPNNNNWEEYKIRLETDNNEEKKNGTKMVKTYNKNKSLSCESEKHNLF